MFLLLTLAASLSEPGMTSLEAARLGLSEAIVEYDCETGQPVACRVAEMTRNNSEGLAQVFTDVIREAQQNCRHGYAFDCEMLKRVDAVAAKLLREHRT